MFSCCYIRNKQPLSQNVSAGIGFAFKSVIYLMIFYTLQVFLKSSIFLGDLDD